MGTRPYFKYYPEEFDSAVRALGLSFEIRGAYQAFINWQWQLGGPVPYDPKRFSFQTGVPTRTCKRVLKILLDFGLIRFVTNDHVENPKMADMIHSYFQKAEIMNRNRRKNRNVKQTAVKAPVKRAFKNDSVPKNPIKTTDEFSNQGDKLEVRSYKYKNYLPTEVETQKDEGDNLDIEKFEDVFYQAISPDQPIDHKNTPLNGSFETIVRFHERHGSLTPNSAIAAVQKLMDDYPPEIIKHAHRLAMSDNIRNKYQYFSKVLANETAPADPALDNRPDWVKEKEKHDEFMKKTSLGTPGIFEQIAALDD